MHIKVSLRPMNVSKDKKALYNQCYKKTNTLLFKRRDQFINKVRKLLDFIFYFLENYEMGIHRAIIHTHFCRNFHSFANKPI